MYFRTFWVVKNLSVYALYKKENVRLDMNFLGESKRGSFNPHATQSNMVRELHLSLLLKTSEPVGRDKKCFSFAYKPDHMHGLNVIYVRKHESQICFTKSCAHCTVTLKMADQRITEKDPL